MLRYPILFPHSKDFLSRSFILEQVKSAWQLIIDDPEYVTPNLSAWFRKNRSLGSRDRKIVAEILFVLIRFQETFAHLGQETLSERLNLLKEDAWPALSNPSVEDCARFLSLDLWIVEEWAKTLSIEDLVQLANHLQSRAPIDIRVNPRKTTIKKLQQLLAKEKLKASLIPDTSLGLRIEGRANLQALGSYRNGFFEVQDAASQIFCEALPIAANASIFDMCAGAGGKSLTLKALYPKTTILAQEPRSNAARELRQRAKRAGANITLAKPTEPVDIVIIDAPCSGLGRLRREPAIRFRWQKQDIKQFVSVQQEILEAAQSYVKDLGIIVYATCSLLRAENQHDLNGWTRESKVLWPHQYDCDGFGYSIFRRK